MGYVEMIIFFIANFLIILTKIVALHRKDQVMCLPEALWAYRTTWKYTNGFTPFEIMYGKSIVILVELKYKKMRTTLELGMELTIAQQDNILSLNNLDEWRSALNNTKLI